MEVIYADVRIAIRPSVVGADSPSGTAEDWFSEALSGNDEILDWAYLDHRSDPRVMRVAGTEAEYDEGTILAPMRCAHCGAPMNITVRAHHHAEDGVDVTR